jgi:nitrate/nitrite transporter NarK
MIGVPGAVTLRSVFIGGIIGLAMGPVSGWVADRSSPRNMLIALQIAQCVCFALMSVSGSSTMVEVALFGAGELLARLVSPVRALIPIRYLDRDAFIPFKSRTKTLTTVVSLVGNASASMAGVVDIRWAALVPLLNAVSYIAALFFTIRLPETGQTEMIPARQKSHRLLRRDFVPGVHVVLASSFICFLAFTIGNVPDSAIPFIIARHFPSYSWTMALLSFASVLISMCGQLLARRFQPTLQKHSMMVLCAGMVIVTVAFALFLGTTDDPEAIGSLPCLFLSSVTSQFGLLLVTYGAWDIQYSAGPDKHRGMIVSMFSTTAGAGSIIGSGIASLFVG